MVEEGASQRPLSCAKREPVVGRSGWERVWQNRNILAESPFVKTRRKKKRIAGVKTGEHEAAQDDAELLAVK